MTSERKIAGLVLGGLVACLGLTVLAYWRGLSGPFLLDDAANISASYIPNVDWDGFVYIITHNGSGLLGRCVSMLSFVLTGLQYGLDPWGYKYHNLLLHLLNGVLLFRLFQLLLPLLDQRLDKPRTLLVAGGAASLWLLHPLLLSTVLYAVQRMTQLSTCFMLLAMLVYLKARTTEVRWQFWFFGWFVLPVLAILGVLSKENGALLPLFLIAIELFAFRTTFADLRRAPRIAAFVGVTNLLPVVLALLILVVAFDDITEYSGRNFTMQGRLLTQLHVIFFYVVQILLPRISTMSLFHDDYPVTAHWDLPTLLFLALLVAILVMAWKVRDKWPVVPFGIAWFLAAHMMESTVLPLELVFEHRNYMASAGLLLVLAWALLARPIVPLLRWLWPALALLFAFMTSARATEWADSDLFHTISIQEHPRSGRATTMYANYLMSRGDVDGARRQLESLLELTPEEVGVILHLQSLNCEAEIRDEAGLAQAVELLEQYPVSVYAYNGLQRLVVNIIDEKCKSLTLADMEPLIDAGIVFATERDTEQRLAYLLRLRGLIALTDGRYAQGYSDFRTAHEMLGDITVLHELMRFQLRRGEIVDAEDTMALMEQQNDRRFGIDTHQVRESREMLESTKRAVELARQAQLEGEPATTTIQ